MNCLYQCDIRSINYWKIRGHILKQTEQNALNLRRNTLANSVLETNTNKEMCERLFAREMRIKHFNEMINNAKTEEEI